MKFRIIFFFYEFWKFLLVIGETGSLVWCLLKVISKNNAFIYTILTSFDDILLYK